MTAKGTIAAECYQYRSLGAVSLKVVMTWICGAIVQVIPNHVTITFQVVLSHLSIPWN